MASLPRSTTSLHSHIASNIGSRPWCGGVLGALLSVLALASTLFLSSRPVFCRIGLYYVLHMRLSDANKRILTYLLKKRRFRLLSVMSEIVLYCIVSIYLYSASCSAHQSEALPVRKTQREESRNTISYMYLHYDFKLQFLLLFLLLLLQVFSPFTLLLLSNLLLNLH